MKTMQSEGSTRFCFVCQQMPSSVHLVCLILFANKTFEIYVSVAPNERTAWSTKTVVTTNKQLGVADARKCARCVKWFSPCLRVSCTVKIEYWTVRAILGQTERHIGWHDVRVWTKTVGCFSKLVNFQTAVSNKQTLHGDFAKGGKSSKVQ